MHDSHGQERTHLILLDQQLLSPQPTQLGSLYLHSSSTSLSTHPTSMSARI